MNITKNSDGSNLTIIVEGKLDANTSSGFLQDVSNDLEGINNLIIDFEPLVYISSAGLRAILSLVKIMNDKGSIKLINVSNTVYSIFEVTGFVDIVEIECK